MTLSNDEQTKAAIAFNVVRYLKKQGRSRYWLSKETGDYQSTIANVCHGRSVCGAGLLTRIASALGVTADDLLKKPKKVRSRA
jgi:hypothetical protein